MPDFEHITIEREFREPPEGWETFGSHAGDEVQRNLVFSYEIDLMTGLPLWERVGDLRAEIGALVKGWAGAADALVEQGRPGVAKVVGLCIKDVEQLFGVQSRVGESDVRPEADG